MELFWPGRSFAAAQHWRKRQSDRDDQRFALPLRAHGGQRWLDLTGSTQSPTGVKQRVATTVGKKYRLGFWVGSAFYGGILGTSSTVNVFANSQLLTSVLADNAHGGEMTWQPFSVTFTATATATTFAFINADPGNDSLNGLDDVSLTLVP
jgi:hypothetical protein